MSNASPGDKPNATELPTTDDSATKDEQTTPENCHKMTQIEPYHGKNSVEKIMKRRIVLSEIINEFNLTRRYTERDLLMELRARGYDISARTLYRDMTELNKSNTYVLELSRDNYSALVERGMRLLDESLHDINKIIGIKRIRNKKTIIKTIDGKQEVTVVKEDSEEKMYSLRIRAINLKTAITKFGLELLAGGIVDVGVAQMDIDFNTFKVELEDLRRQNKILKGLPE
jgi:arginine repressor